MSPQVLVLSFCPFTGWLSTWPTSARPNVLLDFSKVWLLYCLLQGISSTSYLFGCWGHGIQQRQQCCHQLISQLFHCLWHGREGCWPSGWNKNMSPHVPTCPQISPKTNICISFHPYTRMIRTAYFSIKIDFFDTKCSEILPSGVFYSHIWEYVFVKLSKLFKKFFENDYSTWQICIKFKRQSNYWFTSTVSPNPACAHFFISHIYSAMRTQRYP